MGSYSLAPPVKSFVCLDLKQNISVFEWTLDKLINSLPPGLRFIAHHTARRPYGLETASESEMKIPHIRVKWKDLGS